MTVGSLFAGIGGFDLAASRVWGWDCVKWQVEIDPYCQRVLAKHWPNVQRYGDINEITGEELEPVDLICGGFPCQDVSLANPEGAGLQGKRSGLWAEYARILGIIRPKYALLENVPGLFRRGFGSVLGDLDALGYAAEWHCIPASGIGAPHVRDRAWILAYSNRQPLRGAECGEAFGAARRVPPAVWERERVRLDAAAMGVRNVWAGSYPEPGILAVANGLSSGMAGYRNALKAYGNAVVPQIPELLFRWISEIEGAVA